MKIICIALFFCTGVISELKAIMPDFDRLPSSIEEFFLIKEGVLLSYVLSDMTSYGSLKKMDIKKTVTTESKKIYPLMFLRSGQFIRHALFRLKTVFDNGMFVCSGIAANIFCNKEYERLSNFTVDFFFKFKNKRNIENTIFFDLSKKISVIYDSGTKLVLIHVYIDEFYVNKFYAEATK